MKGWSQPNLSLCTHNTLWVHLSLAHTWHQDRMERLSPHGVRLLLQATT